MAASFIDALPKVGRGVLDKENQHCCLCQEEYGTEPSTRGIIERPVKLPCDHIIGSECITLWLTGEGNSCPMCRRVFFFRSKPRVIEEYEDAEGDEDDDDHDLEGEEDDADDDIIQDLDVADFDINNREQYLQHRRATPPLSAPQDLTREVADHAWRRGCERKLYIFFQARNPGAPELYLDEGLELEEHHLNFLFISLEEWGMFNALWGDNVGGESSGHRLQFPTRRDMWDLMRDLGFRCDPILESAQDEHDDGWARNVWYPGGRSRSSPSWWTLR